MEIVTFVAALIISVMAISTSGFLVLWAWGIVDVQWRRRG